MYTFEGFVNEGAFKLLRPVFLTFFIFSILLFISLILSYSRKRKMSGTLILAVSSIILILSSQLLYYHAIIVDEIGLGGDQLSTYLYMATMAICLANPLIFLYLFKERHKERKYIY